MAVNAMVMSSILTWGNDLLSFLCSGNKTKIGKTRKLIEKWETECLNTRFPLNVRSS